MATGDPKPGQGVIVRADFGGGIDQTADAWRVPPSQLSSLVNGRLERVGSVRKRTGYQLIDAPKDGGAAAPNKGAPIAALGTTTQTAIVDVARDGAIDNWTHLNTTAARIANECGYVARSYSPSTTTENNGWTTTGPMSDVIGDVIMLDGNAGSVCECVDYGADGAWFFVVKVTQATSAASSTTVTLTQYDKTTRAVVSEISQTYAGGAASAAAARVYPKLIMYPTLSRIVVVTAYNSAANTGTVELSMFSYASSGLATVATALVPTALDYFEVTIYPTVPESKYRPVCPFDAVSTGASSLFISTFSTVWTALYSTLYTVSATGFTYLGAVAQSTVGLNAFQALSLSTTATPNVVALIATAIPFNAALVPAYQTGTYQVPLYTFNATTGITITSNVNAVTVSTAGAVPVAGRLTVGPNQAAAGAVDSRVVGFAEVMEFTGGMITAHHLVRVGCGVLGGSPADVRTTRSYAIPASRMYLQDASAVSSTARLPLRLPLVVGASQQTFLGRVPLSNIPFTQFVGNYSPNIGTQILVGTEQMTLTAANGSNLTIGPRLQPCPPPSPIQVDGVWHVPHLVALDGSNGFGIGLLRMAARVPGDTLTGSFANLPIAAGGLVQQIDGERASEVTLVDRPTIGAIVATNTAATVSDFQTGDYLVQAVAMYRDSSGNVHRSTPSDPYRHVQATTPNIPRQLTIWFSYQSYTNRNDVQIEFYITEPNGTIPRFWFSAPNVVGTAVGTATVTDSSIGGIGLPALDAPSIYTYENLPTIPIPAARFTTLFKNRLIVGGADDPKSVYYSNPPQAYQGASFAVGNVIRLEHEGGCTAAGNVNDKLILFSNLGTYVVFGQFRDATGAGNAISEVESIHDYIGCTQPTSVVSIPPGLIFFATDSRFYMIDEQLALKPIGLRVQELTPPGMRVVSVVHIEAEREVRFYMYQPGLVPVTRILVYNYQVDQWSRDEVTAIEFSSNGGACYSSHLGTLVVSSSSWAHDTGTTWFDGTSGWITLSCSTAWIQPAGTQEYARFRNAYVLGRSAGSHNLTVQVFTDFDETTVRSAGTWTAAQLAPIPGTVWPEQVRLQVGNQKTQSTKIQIFDSPPSGATTGQGPQLVGLALEVLPLGGVKRLPASRSR